MEFAPIKLLPGKPAHKLFVPPGEVFVMKQIALAAPATKGTTAIVSIKTENYPELVLCTLRADTPQVHCEIAVNDLEEAQLTVRGAAVDICGQFVVNEDMGDEEIDEDEGEDDDEEDDDETRARMVAARKGVRQMDDEEEEEEGDEEVLPPQRRGRSSGQSPSPPDMPPAQRARRSS